MKRIITLFLLCSLPFIVFAQTNLEEYFNLCLEFGAPLAVVELFQPFRTYKGENNGSVSYVVREDFNLIKGSPYSEYQIWYTIDKEHGLYQSTLIVRGDKPVLQNALTSYLKKFSALYGEPVYTNLDNGSLLIFWYDETRFTIKARLILDIVNAYKFVSITFCSPLSRHEQLLKTLYNGTPEEENENRKPGAAPPSEFTDVSAEEESFANEEPFVEEETPAEEENFPEEETTDIEISGEEGVDDAGENE